MPRGIFPLVDNEVCAELGLNPWAPGRVNYESFNDYKLAADAVTQEERDLGRLDLAPTIEELAEKHGETARRRIAVIAKEKQGKTTVRLVHDLVEFLVQTTRTRSSNCPLTRGKESLPVAKHSGATSCTLSLCSA